MTSLQGAYDPQRQLVAQQQAALPGQQAAEQAGLDTAKTNAFGDITKASNDRGVLYSGVPIAEESRYVGERYLPAVANLKATYADRGTKLQAALFGINDSQRQEAQGTLAGQQKAEAEAASRAEQLALERERMASTERAAATRASTAKAPSASDRQAAFNQDLMAAFQYANSNYKPFIREQVAQQLASTYGVPIDTAQKQVNSVFTDSWDKAKRGKK